MAHFLAEYRELGNPAAREAHRAAHIAYRKGLGTTMALAGPLLDEAEQPTGSVIIIEAPNRAAAEAMAIADPYLAAGVFALVSVRRYRIAAMYPPG